MAVPTVTPVGANAITGSSASLIGAVNPNGAATTWVFQYSDGNYSQVVAADSPTGYWHLDETTGTVATDSADTHPGAYTGTVSLGQTTIVNGGTRAVVVAGAGTMTVPYNPALFGGSAGPFSWEIWAKPTTIDASHRGLMRGTNTDLFVAQVAGTNIVTATLNNGAVSMATVGPVTLAAVHHFVLTYDGTRAVLYLDGVARATTLANLTASVSGSLVMGGDVGFVGTLDEPAVYTYALSQTQIAEHYAVGTVGYVTTPPVSAGSGTAPVTVTAPIAGLTPQTTYTYALSATNSSGTVVSYTRTFTATPLSGSGPILEFGQPEVIIPHFSLPFTLQIDPNESVEIAAGGEHSDEVEGSAVVVEQDSEDEIAACVRAVLSCPIGACQQLPGFGVTPELFSLAPIDTQLLVSEVQEWEPRATLAITTALVGDGGIQQVNVEVSNPGTALT